MMLMFEFSMLRCVERLARANEESQGNAYYDNRFNTCKTLQHLQDF